MAEPEKPSEKPKELQKEVADKYLLEDASVHSFFPGFGEIDLSTINLKKADELTKNGFKWLVEKDSKTKAPATKA